MDELPDMMRLANGKDDCTCNVAEHSPDPREHDQYCAFPLLHRGAAEIARLTRERDEAKDDALRLHGDKMAFFDAALALVHSETIKNVCGWYPAIEAFRVLLKMPTVREQSTAEEG